MKQIKILILLLTLFIGCREKSSIRAFDLSTPRQKTIRLNRLRNIYFVLSNPISDKWDGQIGDTLYVENYDTLGNITEYRHLNWWGHTIRNYYDHYGYLKYRTINTDYSNHYFVSSFIDTTKLILYQKWSDELSDYPNTIFYFNKRDLIDSCQSAYYSQGIPTRYKEIYFYEHDRLLKTIKYTVDTGKAIRYNTPIIEQTEYYYSNGNLAKIKKTQTFPFKEMKSEIEYFDARGIPVRKEIDSDGRIILLNAKNNGY